MLILFFLFSAFLCKIIFMWLTLQDTNKDSAVKIISKKKLSEDDLSALMTEISILCELNHPHIIKYVLCLSIFFLMYILLDRAHRYNPTIIWCNPTIIWCNALCHVWYDMICYDRPVYKMSWNDLLLYDIIWYATINLTHHTSSIFVYFVFLPTSFPPFLSFVLMSHIYSHLILVTSFISHVFSSLTFVLISHITHFTYLFSCYVC